MGTSVGGRSAIIPNLEALLVIIANEPKQVRVTIVRRFLDREVKVLSARAACIRQMGTNIEDEDPALNVLCKDLADEYDDRVRKGLVVRISELDGMEAVNSSRLSEVLARMPKLNIKWASFAVVGIAMLILVVR